MLRVKKILVAAAAALAMLTVTGCGDDAADVAASAADGGAGPDKGGDDNAPCDLVEAAEVAAILGETPEPQRNVANPSGQVCLWDQADDKQSLWLQLLAPRSNPEQHLNGYGWTAETFTRWADSEAEPVDGLGDEAIYQGKDQLGGGGKEFALSVLHHGERVFAVRLHVKGADGSEAGATLDKLRPLAAKIVERH